MIIEDQTTADQHLKLIRWVDFRFRDHVIRFLRVTDGHSPDYFKPVTKMVNTRGKNLW